MSATYAHAYPMNEDPRSHRERPAFGGHHQGMRHGGGTLGSASMDNDIPTHPVLIGYLFWLLGFTGAHRFYFGKPITGTIWFFTFGLFLVGWIVDAFLIPEMAQRASRRYQPAPVDYSVTWTLLLFLGLFGVHRFYMGKVFTGVLYLLTGGLLGVGIVYDVCTLNDQIEQL